MNFYAPNWIFVIVAALVSAVEAQPPEKKPRLSYQSGYETNAQPQLSSPQEKPRRRLTYSERMDYLSDLVTLMRSAGGQPIDTRGLLQIISAYGLQQQPNESMHQFESRILADIDSARKAWEAHVHRNLRGTPGY